MSLYLVLLQVGFTMPLRVTTNAVRSYRTISTLPAANCLGGLFSAALSVGSRPPGITWHPVQGARTFLASTRAAAMIWPTPSTSLPV